MGELTLFKKDAHSFFVLKKAEKLTAALYLITDRCPQEEPLRDMIRKRGLHILSLIASSGGGSEVHEREEEVGDAIAEILSLLTIGAVGGYISEMNRGILDKEYHQLLQAITRQGPDARLRSRRTFSGDFFDISIPLSLRNGNEENTPHAQVWGKEMWNEPHKGHDKGHLKTQLSDIPRQDTGKDIASHPRHTPGTGSTLSKKYQPEVAKRQSRRSAIIQLVKRRGKVSVKDISLIVHGYSGKTLQRELVALVQEGVLKREGERRWSTYSLT